MRLTTPGFDVLGLIPATRFLVAYAAAAAAALIWRTVGGLVAGLVVAGVVVIGTTMLQPAVVPHSRELLPCESPNYLAHFRQIIWHLRAPPTGDPADHAGAPTPERAKETP